MSTQLSVHIHFIIVIPHGHQYIIVKDINHKSLIYMWGSHSYIPFQEGIRCLLNYGKHNLWFIHLINRGLLLMSPHAFKVSCWFCHFCFQDFLLCFLSQKCNQHFYKMNTHRHWFLLLKFILIMSPCVSTLIVWVFIVHFDGSYKCSVIP